MLSDPKSARVQTAKPVTLNTQNEAAPRSARTHCKSEFSYKYEYPEDLPEAVPRPVAPREHQNDTQSSGDESSESVEEDCPDFFSIQEFLQSSSQTARFKEGRV